MGNGYKKSLCIFHANSEMTKIMVWFTSEKKIFCVKCDKMWTVIRLIWRILTRRAYIIPRKFRNGKTYVTSQGKLNVVTENDLNNLQSECEILKLRKNNLFENIANQDKILEVKLREGKKTTS